MQLLKQTMRNGWSSRHLNLRPSKNSSVLSVNASSMTLLLLTWTVLSSSFLWRLRQRPMDLLKDGKWKNWSWRRCSISYSDAAIPRNLWHLEELGVTDALDIVLPPSHSVLFILAIAFLTDNANILDDKLLNWSFLIAKHPRYKIVTAWTIVVYSGHLFSSNLSIRGYRFSCLTDNLLEMALPHDWHLVESLFFSQSWRASSASLSSVEFTLR